MPAVDDLEVISELLTGKPPSPDVNHYVKERLTAVIAAESHPGAGRPAPARRRRPARPLLLLTGAASAALAAGLAVVLAVTSSAARPPGAPGFAPASTAAAVLRNAALAALAEPTTTPQPDQFVYSKVYGTMTCGADSSTGVDQAWLSVSGTHRAMDTGTGSVTIRAGMTIRAGNTIRAGGHRPGTSSGPACKGARVFPPSLTEPRPIRCPCTPADFAAYTPGMPTRPAALRAWLDRRYHVSPGPAGVIYLLGITDDLLVTTYLTPAQHMAMYEMLAQTPSLTVVPKASTILGRTGVGVRWTVRTGAAGHRPAANTFTLVFNRKTYRLLGMNWDLSGAVGGEALIRLAIVNKPGQLP